GSNYANPCPFGQCAQHDTDGALTNYQNRFSGPQRHAFDSLHAGIHRLHKTGLLKGCAFRNPNRPLLNNPVHYADELGKAAARGLKTCCTAHLLVRLKLGKSFVTAVVTIAARNVVEDHNTITDRESRYFRSNSGNSA